MIREYFLFSAILTVLIFAVYKRISFERHLKDEEYNREKYISLFREHNTIMILLFTAVCIDLMIKILHL